MTNPFQQLGSFADYLPTLLLALGILIIGWLVALIVSRLIGNLLGRTSLDDRIARLTNRDTSTPEQRIQVERWVSTAVFWVIMLFVIVAVLQTLNLSIVSAPLNSLLSQILAFIPSLLSALALIFIAWLVATVLRLVVTRVVDAAGLSRRLAENARVQTPGRVSLGETAGNIVYWLVFLFFLPAILGALNLQGILAPVQTMVNEILGILPNLLAAALILLVGWLAARIVRQVVTGLLATVGVDRVGERAGIPAENRTRLSSVIGTVVYVLILIPVAIAALNALNIPAISQPAAAMLTSLLNALPAIFGAVILLALAYFVARILRDFITNILSGLGFDRLFSSMGMYRETRATGGSAIPATGEGAAAMPRPTTWSPSRILGTIVMVAILLFAAIEASNLLGFTILASVLGGFIVAAGNILIGLLVFGIGLYLAALADRAIRGSGVQQAGTLATVARIAIMIFAGAIALRQMGLGEDIVNLAFGLLMGAVAVAAALAFGLGGREAASRQIEQWRSDIRSGKMDAGPATIPTTGGGAVDVYPTDVTGGTQGRSSELDEDIHGAPFPPRPDPGIPPTGRPLDDEGFTGPPDRPLRDEGFSEPPDRDLGDTPEI